MLLLLIPLMMALLGLWCLAHGGSRHGGVSSSNAAAHGSRDGAVSSSNAAAHGSMKEATRFCSSMAGTELATQHVPVE
jgi:hypothetical protein